MLLSLAVCVIIIVIFGTPVADLLSVPIVGWIDQAPALQQKFTSNFSDLGFVLEKFSNLTDQIQNRSIAAQYSPVQEVVVRQHSFPGLLISLVGYPIRLGVTLVRAEHNRFSTQQCRP